MCWACDNPDAGWDDWLDHLRGIVDNCGWAVQSIERDGDRPPWAYTVGLTEIGRPEVVVTGMSMVRSAELLNLVAGHFAHAEPDPPGTRIPLPGWPPLEVVELAEPSAHLHSAVALYGAGVRALQLVHADDRGHWPWDKGYRGVRGGQPVLGARASPAPPP